MISLIVSLAVLLLAALVYGLSVFFGAQLLQAVFVVAFVILIYGGIYLLLAWLDEKHPKPPEDHP